MRIGAQRVASASRVAGRGVWDRLHQLAFDELSEAQELDWSRACIDGVSVRAKRAAC